MGQVCLGKLDTLEQKPLGLGGRQAAVGGQSGLVSTVTSDFS